MRKILLVEDEPSIADNIIYALKTEGFAPTWCQTGADALVKFHAGAFALVILDVGLPDVNGFELCKKFRAASTVPIVFVTARKGEIDRVVGLEIGADDYVVKPFSPRELTARVKAILRRADSSTAPAPPLAAVFTVDDERCEIRYHGVPLQLSRYEFRLLKVLVQKPGRVYSRDQLMELAWEEPDTALDRTVPCRPTSTSTEAKAALARCRCSRSTNVKVTIAGVIADVCVTQDRGCFHRRRSLSRPTTWRTRLV